MMNCCSHLSDISNVIPKTPNGCEGYGQPNHN